MREEMDISIVNGDAEQSSCEGNLQRALSRFSR